MQEENSDFDESDFEDSIPSDAEIESWNQQQKHRMRAKAVFDEMMYGLPDLPASFDDEDMLAGQKEFDAHIKKLNDLISSNLDTDSIWEFVHLSGKLRTSIAAISKANKRHKENHAMKADAFKWLDGNFDNCTSMDSAAEMMAGKLVPATFRTVRGWVTEWRKLRSAGTP